MGAIAATFCSADILSSPLPPTSLWSSFSCSVGHCSGPPTVSGCFVLYLCLVWLQGYGVELPAHKPANIPSGNMAGRGSTGFGSEQVTLPPARPFTLASFSTVAPCSFLAIRVATLTMLTVPSFLCLPTRQTQTSSAVSGLPLCMAAASACLCQMCICPGRDGWRWTFSRHEGIVSG